VPLNALFGNESSQIALHPADIAKHMRFGRQEDAHEFTRYVIEGLQKSCLAMQGEYADLAFLHLLFPDFLISPSPPIEAPSWITVQRRPR